LLAQAAEKLLLRFTRTSIAFQWATFFQRFIIILPAPTVLSVTFTKEVTRPALAGDAGSFC